MNLDPASAAWEWWDALALVVQVVFTAGLYICWSASRSSPTAGRMAMGSRICMAAGAVLTAYALYRGEMVFVVGEVVLTIAAGATAFSARERPRSKPPAPRGFPVVAPDSAEWKVIKPSKNPPIADEGISPPIS